MLSNRRVRSCLVASENSLICVNYDVMLNVHRQHFANVSRS